MNSRPVEVRWLDAGGIDDLFAEAISAAHEARAMYESLSLGTDSWVRAFVEFETKTQRAWKMWETRKRRVKERPLWVATRGKSSFAGSSEGVLRNRVTPLGTGALLSNPSLQGHARAEPVLYFGTDPIEQLGMASHGCSALVQFPSGTVAEQEVDLKEPPTLTTASLHCSIANTAYLAACQPRENDVGAKCSSHSAYCAQPVDLILSELVTSLIYATFLCLHYQHLQKDINFRLFARYCERLLEWAYIVCRPASKALSDTRLDAAEYALWASVELDLHTLVEDRSKRRILEAARSWANQIWEIDASSKSSRQLFFAAHAASDACMRLAQLPTTSSQEQEVLRGEVERWGIRAWAFKGDPVARPEALLNIANRVLCAITHSVWQVSGSNSSRSHGEELARAADWCKAANSLDSSLCEAGTLANVYANASRISHELSHLYCDDPFLYHYQTIAWAQRLWTVREQRWEFAVHIGVGKAICCLKRLAIGSELEDRQDEFFGTVLLWADAARDAADCPNRTLWLEAGVEALSSLIVWIRRLIMRERRQWSSSAAFFSRLVVTRQRSGDAPVREKLKRAQTMVSEMATTVRSHQGIRRGASSTLFGQTAAAVIVHSLLEDGPHELAELLADALVVCRWVGAEAEFWRSIPGEVNSYTEVASFWRRQAFTKKVFLSGTPDDLMTSWFLATVQAFAITANTRVHLLNGWQVNQGVSLIELSLHKLAALHARVGSESARMYSFAALKGVSRLAVDRLWTTSWPIPRRQFVGLMLLIQSTNDLYLRLKAEHTLKSAEGSLSRAGTGPSRREGFLSLWFYYAVGTSERMLGLTKDTGHEGHTFLSAANQVAKDEGNTFVHFFDTHHRIIRVTLDPRGELLVTELDRGQVVRRYQRYISLIADLDATLRRGTYYWKQGEELRECVASLGDMLLGGIKADRITLLPHGFTHDALTATAQHWGAINACSVEQTASIGLYLLLRGRFERIRETLPSRLCVLIILSDDIGIYGEVANAVVQAVGRRCDVFRYRVRRHPEMQDGLLTIQAELEFWDGRYPWRKSSEQVVKPDVCFWFTHGHFDATASDVLGRASFGFFAGARTPHSCIPACDIGVDGSVVLPVLEQELSSQPIDVAPHRQANTVKVDLRRCSLVVSGACSSGRIAEELSEDLPGLLRGFFLAGVPTVIAASWPVPIPLVPQRQRTPARALWEALIEGLTNFKGQGNTIADVVRFARQSASEFGGHRFAEWGHLGLHGLGSVPSPLWLRDSREHSPSREPACP